MIDEDAYAEAAARTERLSQVDTELRAIQVAVDRKVKKIRDESTARAEPLSAERDKLMAETAQWYLEQEPMFEMQGKKTIRFPGGSIYSRSSPGKLVITDGAKAMKSLRRRRLLRRFTKPGERTFNVAELKKHPEVVDSTPGMHIEKPRFVYVKLARTQVELKEPLHPYRIDSK